MAEGGRIRVNEQARTADWLYQAGYPRGNVTGSITVESGNLVMKLHNELTGNSATLTRDLVEDAIAPH